MISIFNDSSFWKIYVCQSFCRLICPSTMIPLIPQSHSHFVASLVSSQRLPTRDSFQGGFALVEATCWFLGSTLHDPGEVREKWPLQNAPNVMTWWKTITSLASQPLEEGQFIYPIRSVFLVPWCDVSVQAGSNNLHSAKTCSNDCHVSLPEDTFIFYVTFRNYKSMQN